MEPLDHLGRLYCLHHTGEVDEATPGVKEHLGTSQELGHRVLGVRVVMSEAGCQMMITLHSQVNNARNVRRGGHLTFVVP